MIKYGDRAWRVMDKSDNAALVGYAPHQIAQNSPPAYVQQPQHAPLKQPAKQPVRSPVKKQAHRKQHR